MLGTITRSIQVEVKHLYDMSTAADSLLTDVTILLFEDRDNFAFGGYPDAFLHYRYHRKGLL